MKNARYRFKRIVKRPATRPDPEEVRRAEKRLQRFARQDRDGKIQLLFADAAGFALSSVQPYAWQSSDQPLHIPAQGHHLRLNVFGIFSTSTQRMDALVFEKSMDDRCVIAAIDHFFAQRSDTRPVVLVIDNAPIHHTNDMKEAQGRWKRLGIRLEFLPPYSPELNPIEMVWKQMKHYWLRLSAFESFARLRAEVYRVLNAIGSEYRISFQ